MPWQPAAIVYPDAVAWACDFVRGSLAERTETYASGVHVADDVPNPRLERMVIIRRDGGLEGELVDNPRLNFSIWAGTKEDCTDLVRLVRALLWTAPTGNPVTKVNLGSGPVTVKDESGQPNQYFVAEVSLRGQPLGPSN